MLVYYCLLAIVTALGTMAARAGHSGPRRVAYLLILVALVAVPAVRSRFVGTDAGYYVRFFNQTGSLGYVFRQRLEPGYFVLSWLGHFISDDYVSVFSLVALVVGICFVWAIRYWSVNTAMSLFVLLVSGTYFVSFNGVRQGVASAVYFLAIGAVLRRRFGVYSGVVAVASLFHMTAITTLPVYFLVTRRGGLRANLAIAALAGGAMVYFDQLLKFSVSLEERYEVYGRIASEGRGLWTMAFLCVLWGAFIIFRRYVVRYRSIYDVLLNMFSLGTAIAFVTALQGLGASGIRRLSLYYLPAEVLLWPIVFVNLRGRAQRRIFLFAFFSLYVVYYSLTLQRFSNLVPYTLNPVVEQWLGL